MVVVPGLGAARAPTFVGSSRSPRVLLIDHQPLFRAALGRILTGPPIAARIQVVSTSDAGLEIARGGDTQLVFCDIHAKPISALELAHELSSFAPPVPLIVLGDREDAALMTTVLETTVAGLFTKDSPIEDFLAGVEAVLSGHRAVGANLMGHVVERLAGRTREVRKTPNGLSPTELEILAQIGKARSIPAIAASRGISHKTVRNHLANIYRKLDLRSRTEAMLCAARMGLTAD